MAADEHPFEEISGTLKKVGAALRDNEIPYLLGGSLAFWAHGGPERRRDLDFMVKPEDADRALEVLEAAGMRTEKPPEGWLYKASGERWKGSQTTLTVTEEAGGQRFRLSVYNMRLGCPYLDRHGDQARARFRFVQTGLVNGDVIDDTREFPAQNPTHRIRFRGRFDGTRFTGRMTVGSAPGVAGACTGSARVKVSQ